MQFCSQETTSEEVPRLLRGPQLVFGIAPPGTGKTAVVSHILNLFPVHTLLGFTVRN